MTTLFEDVDAVFTAWDKLDSPGCALAIVQHGKVIYARGYGMAHLEYDIPITPHSIFHIASLSKQFTAYAITQLAHEGKISLNDDIRTYLPEMPTYAAPIYIDHLIHHTSGLRDQWDLFALAGWRQDDVKTNADVLDLAKRQRHLNFAPGEQYVYCNTGYTLLALIVERVTSQSFRAYADTAIFKPLGMTQTHFHDDHTEIVKNRAYAYQPKKAGGYSISIPVFDTVGATSLFTVVGDLARWTLYLEEQLANKEQRVTHMLTPGKLNNDQEISYGSGFELGTYRGLPCRGHSGSDAGYRSDFIWFPEQRFAVIILGNVSTLEPTRKLSWQVADLFLSQHFVTEGPTQQQEPSPVEPAASTNNTEDSRTEIRPEHLNEYIGTYYSEELLITYEISVDKERLVFKNRRLQLDRYFQPPVEDKVTEGRFTKQFVRNEDGFVVGLTFSTGRTYHIEFVKQQNSNA